MNDHVSCTTETDDTITRGAPMTGAYHTYTQTNWVHNQPRGWRLIATAIHLNKDNK